jgi:hypothetical protein
LTGSQVQMLLGTMLGDGSIDCRNQNPKYVSRHGHCQHEYNMAKYLVLSEFASKPPEKVKNYGYGEWSSLWYTRTWPEFHPIASLCLHEGKKRVTQTWLDQLTWEGAAWWYQDDGGLCGQIARFNTHGFTEDEVVLLASWLTRNGVEARAVPASNRRRTNCYWIVQLTAASTHILAEKIRPWVVPSMLYKVDLKPRTTSLRCFWCDRKFIPTRGRGIYSTVRRPCCGSKDCRQSQHRDISRRHAAIEENRLNHNAKGRERYHCDIAAARERGRKYAAARRERNPQATKDTKARYLAKKRTKRAESIWTCARCKLEEPKGNRDAKTKYCAMCRILVDREIKAKSAMKRKSSASSGPASIP